MNAAVDLPLIQSGKVREMYDLGEAILMVASDRISTYDVVHPTPIPDKGKVLTGLSVFWFERTGDIVPNHLDLGHRGRARARCAAGRWWSRKLEMVPVECVVRGYITGSGWKEYQRDGSVCGIALPAGLEESQRLPEPIFTPATKAEVGDHDENVDFERAAEIVGDRALMERLRDVSIALYEHGAAHARERGIILADTKFEFGLDAERNADRRRRGADARLLPLLARRRVRAGPRAAELRQAVRPRLGVGERLGQVAPGAGDPRRRGRAHAREVRRGLRADRRRAVRRLAGAGRA